MIIQGKVSSRTTITQTLNVQRLIRHFYQVDDSKVMKLDHVKKRKCFVCGKGFELGDWVNVAITDKGNKCLCDEHCPDE